MELVALWVSLALAGERTAPEISTDPGVPEGVVVLWPRVVPGGREAVARAAGWQVQRALSRLSTEVAPTRAMSVRPEPQRVCPRGGCAGPRIGALIIREKKACAVVATVGGPGETPLALVPWVGSVHLNAAEIPFRAPPESWVGVRDFVPCDRLAEPLEVGAPAVRLALERLYADGGVPAP